MKSQEKKERESCDLLCLVEAPVLSFRKREGVIYGDVYIWDR